MIKTPVKPKMTANHLWRPIFSFNIGPEKATTINGKEDNIEWVWTRPSLVKE